jgi:hypothetical protein
MIIAAFRDTQGCPRGAQVRDIVTQMYLMLCILGQCCIRLHLVFGAPPFVLLQGSLALGLLGPGSRGR